MNNAGLRTPFVVALMAVVGAMAFGETISRGDDVAAWQPEQTQVFLVSLTRFKSNRLHAFSTDDRLDDHFAQLFRERGVPANQIVLLKDDDATSQNVKREFTNLLRQCRPGETLFFYFGSHGGFNRETGEYSFCAFNESVSFSWVFDAIEHDFRGAQVILTTDCCYSGGIVELAKKRKLSVACACLSSTYSHQVARSGWRFAQCLIRGLDGNPVVDLDGNGNVDLDELASYTARYMAFVADGKPMFHVTGNFNPKLRLATTAGTKGPRVGEFLEVHSDGIWKKAEVLDADAQRLKIHFTEDTRTAHDAWFPVDQVRPFRFEKFKPGRFVEVENDSGKGWHAAKVLDNWESLHLCLQDGHSPTSDEWYGPSRVRQLVAGSWSGRWQNSADESGAETLKLVQNHGDYLSGTWSGDVTVHGERIGNETIYFEGTKPGRFYRCAGRIEDACLRLNYVAQRTNSHGHYYGWANLSQQGGDVEAIRDTRLDFQGRWTGTYENSRGGNGSETLVVTENDDKLQGVWSGVDVSGERLGNSMFFLEGRSGKRLYHVIGHVSHGQLVLDYSAMEGNERYTGRSMLNR